METVAPSVPRVHPRRIRMRYGREGATRFLSHLDLIKVIERAIRRTPLKGAFTEGFHPRLRLAFASALPVGAESVGEYMDLDLDLGEPSTAADVQRVLNGTLPPGLRVLDAKEIRFPCKSLGGIIGMSVWHLHGPGLADAGPRVEAAFAAATLPVVRRSQRRDVRPYLERITVHPEHLEAWIRITPAGSIKPDELLTVFGYPPPQFRACRRALLAPVGGTWVEPWGETVM